MKSESRFSLDMASQPFYEMKIVSMDILRPLIDTIFVITDWYFTDDQPLPEVAKHQRTVFFDLK